MKQPLVRLLIVAVIYLSVIKMGYGLLTAMVVTFALLLGLKILVTLAGFFLGGKRKARRV